MPVKLPYFDMILSRLEAGDPEFEEAFWRHTHFGLWEEPEKANSDQADSITAMERMCLFVTELADIQPGQKVLDVGCGFGGTLASLDQRMSPLQMTGLNIDERQLQVARKRVVASPGNSIDFLQGDACDMDFPEGSFDRVLATECIFHFPSRERFFQHVARVLRPGGNLTLTDFVYPEGVPVGQWDSDESVWGSQISVDVPTYLQLAEEAGLELVYVKDISVQVRPTYHWFGRLLEKHFPGSEQAVLDSRVVVDVGGLGYCALRFNRR